MSEAGESMERLLGVMRTLRAPDGCPWDREQPHELLKSDLIECGIEKHDFAGRYALFSNHWNGPRGNDRKRGSLVPSDFIPTLHYLYEVLVVDHEPE